MRNAGAVAASLVLGGAFLLGPLRAGAMGGDALYSKLAPSIWTVRTYDADGIALAIGSAVVVGSGALVTNCHVLAKASRVAIKKEGVAHEAKLQHIDVERDLCQIRVANLAAPSVAVGNSEHLVVGQRVYTIGNPEGLALTFSDGLVSALRRGGEKQLQLIQISAPISHGSSGGGLFDEQGRLVGITTLTARDGQNLNFAIPINWLRDLPQRSTAALAAYRGRATAPEKGSEERAPTRPAYAAVDNVSKLPVQSEQARAGYQTFLSRPLPRAFAISADGHWWESWGEVRGDPFANEPAGRAVRNCEKRAQQRCVLYAQDLAVVYRGEFSSPVP